jgi:hypothetical protein
VSIRISITWTSLDRILGENRRLSSPQQLSYGMPLLVHVGLSGDNRVHTGYRPGIFTGWTHKPSKYRPRGFLVLNGKFMPDQEEFAIPWGEFEQRRQRAGGPPYVLIQSQGCSDASRHRVRGCVDLRGVPKQPRY